MTLAIIGMGGNLGDPRENLTRALELLAAGFKVVKKSSLYRTAAVGGPPGQPDCYNAVTIVNTNDTPPLEVLKVLHEIERQLGRIREEKWGPRIIDLDLLDHGGAIMDKGELILPHPMMHSRAFVLAPLAEIAPGWKHPKSGLTPGRMLEKLPEEDKSVILSVEDWPR